MESQEEDAAAGDVDGCGAFEAPPRLRVPRKKLKRASQVCRWGAMHSCCISL